MTNEMPNPIEEEIRSLIQRDFSPDFLEILNDSKYHSRQEAESHFRIYMVSDSFVGLNSLNRQKTVNQTLAPVYPKTHSISLQLYTHKEWATKNKEAGNHDLIHCKKNS